MTTETVKKKRRTGETKKDYHTISVHAYNNFKESTGLDIDKAVWKKVILEYNQGLVDHMIYTGEKISLMHGLGTTHIRKKKHHPEWIIVNGQKVMKNAPIDWPATHKAGKMVRTLNYHTDFFKCSWIWGRNSARFLNANCWIFRFCRTAKRGLAAHLKSDNSRYSLDRYDEIITY